MAILSAAFVISALALLHGAQVTAPRDAGTLTLRIIVVNSADEAQRARQRVIDGESFVALAARVYDADGARTRVAKLRRSVVHTLGRKDRLTVSRPDHAAVFDRSQDSVPETMWTNESHTG